METARQALPTAPSRSCNARNPKAVYNFVCACPRRHRQPAQHRGSGPVQRQGPGRSAFRTDSRGYYWFASIAPPHGDLFGNVGHVITFTLRLLLVVMVITGVVIWGEAGCMSFRGVSRIRDSRTASVGNLNARTSASTRP